MALDLEATAGAEDANSYADLDDVVAILAYEPDGAAFLALDPDPQTQWVVKASRAIDTLEINPGLIGEREFANQSMAFPRGTTELPDSLVYATVRLAVWLHKKFVVNPLVDPLSPDANSGNIKVVEVPGAAKVEFFGATTVPATGLLRFPPEVQRYLEEFILEVAAAVWATGTAERGS